MEEFAYIPYPLREKGLSLGFEILQGVFRQQKNKIWGKKKVLKLHEMARNFIRTFKIILPPTPHSAGVNWGLSSVRRPGSKDPNWCQQNFDSLCTISIMMFQD
jgi:hypothetical protein